MHACAATVCHSLHQSCVFVTPCLSSEIGSVVWFNVVCVCVCHYVCVCVCVCVHALSRAPPEDVDGMIV